MVALAHSNFKPKALKVQLDNIPAELRSLRRWVLWRYEYKGNKWTKVLYDPNKFYDWTEHKRASSTDPKTWGSFGSVFQIYSADADQIDGIGFVLTAGDGIVGIDLDNTSGMPDYEANFLKINTYAERSPSGKGLRMIGLGTLPDNAGRKRDHVELYNHARYLTITGHVIPGRDNAVRPVQREIDATLRAVFPAAAPVAKSNLDRPALDMADGEVLQLARDHDKSGRFAALWDCDEAKLTKKDDGSVDMSRAVAGLLVKLAYYTRDPAQLERLVSASGLGDHHRWASQKWRDRTIGYALRVQQEQYTPRGVYSDAELAAAVGDGWGDPRPFADDPAGDDLAGTYDGLEMRRRSRASKTDFLFTDILETGVITLFCGLPYSGKSLVTLQMIRALVRGEPFNGHVCTKPGTPVLYVNADRLRDRQFDRRLSVVCDGDEGILLGLLPYIQFTDVSDLPSTVTSDYLARLVRGMQRKHGTDTVLVIIDTMRPAFLLDQGAGAENDPGTMTQLLGPVRQLAGETGCPVLLLHHNNRGRDDYAGSAAIAGTTDAVWRISKKDGSTTADINMESRDSGAMFMSVTLGQTPAPVTPAPDPVTEFVMRFPAGEKLTLAQVAALFPELSEPTVRRRLEEAQRAGVHPRVERIGTGKRGDPYLYFRV